MILSFITVIFITWKRWELGSCPSCDVTGSLYRVFVLVISLKCKLQVLIWIFPDQLGLGGGICMWALVWSIMETDETGNSKLGPIFSKIWDAWLKGTGLGQTSDLCLCEQMHCNGPFRTKIVFVLVTADFSGKGRGSGGGKKRRELLTLLKYNTKIIQCKRNKNLFKKWSSLSGSRFFSNLLLTHIPWGKYSSASLPLLGFGLLNHIINEKTAKLRPNCLGRLGYYWESFFWPAQPPH